jgi:hypothetical protein
LRTGEGGKTRSASAHSGINYQLFNILSMLMFTRVPRPAFYPYSCEEK